MKTKKITLMAMLLGLALIIFTVEAQIPPIAPIPGIKLGLANVINIMALYMLGRKESFIILVLRIVLSSIFASSIIGFMYSISGGLVCFFFISIMSLFLKENRTVSYTHLVSGKKNTAGVVGLFVPYSDMDVAADELKAEAKKRKNDIKSEVEDIEQDMKDEFKSIKDDLSISSFFGGNKNGNNKITNSASGVLDSVAPVSYTHLDVYKRQE